MHTEQVTLVKREDLNKAIKLQYDLDDNYDCWDALFGKMSGYSLFEFITDLSNMLNIVMNTLEENYEKDLQIAAITLQYLVDCGYDRILIEY